MEISDRLSDAAGAGLPGASLLDRAIFENALNAILLADDDSRYLDANPAACRMLGYGREELVGLTASAIIVPGSMNIDAAWVGFLQSGTSRGRVQLRRKDGAVIVAEFRAVAHMLPGVHLSVLADITEEVALQQRQVELRTLLDLAMMDAEVAYWDTDLVTGRVSSVNRHWHTMLGYGEGEIADEQTAWAALVHPDDVPRRTAAWAAHMEGRAPVYAVDLRMRHKAGHWLWLQVRGQVVERDAQGRALRMIGTRMDISARKLAEHQLEGLAHTDSLTGVLNRRRFAELAADAIAIALRHGQPVAVLMVDLDHFKAINDRFGHAAGDEVLRAFAHSAASVMRQGELFARVGGEEFAALLPQTDVEGALALAQRLRQRIRDEPARAAGHTVPCTVSIGVACLAADGAGPSSIESLMRRADAALYLAKAEGRDRVVAAEGP